MDNDVYTDEVKEEEILSSDISKPAAYQKFAFNVTPTGHMMPTGALTDFSLQFGGNGEDGAGEYTSGNTNIDVGGAKVYELNFKTLSVTGSASITFTNPHANGTLVFIKVQGDANLTSSATPMIDVSGMGAAGGAGGVDTNTDAEWAAGTIGSDGEITPFATNGGNFATGGASPAVGAANTKIDSTVFTGAYAVISKYTGMFVGAGGGGGNAQNDNSSQTATGGTGGNGGGALVMEVAGSWNFTTSNGISVAGDAGNDGALTSDGRAGGGGGGGGGSSFILYRTLIANSGTVNVSGGTGGNCAITGGGTAYGGAGGGSGENGGNAGTSTTTDATQTGGDGGDGYSLVAQNTYYA